MPRKSMAQMAQELEDGIVGRLVERPRARTFDVISAHGTGYTTTLGARPDVLERGDGDSCDCPARGRCYHIDACRLRASKVPAVGAVPDGWEIRPTALPEGATLKGVVVRYELRGPAGVTAEGVTYPASRAYLSRQVSDDDWAAGDEWLSSDALKAKAALYLALAEDLDRRAAAGA